MKKPFLDSVNSPLSKDKKTERMLNPFKQEVKI